MVSYYCWLWSLDSGPVVRLCVIARNTLWRKSIHFPAAEKQGKKRKKRDANIPFKGRPPLTQLPSTWPHLLKFPPLPHCTTS